jgi:hypothetical protein
VGAVVAQRPLALHLRSGGKGPSVQTRSGRGSKAELPSPGGPPAGGACPGALPATLGP